MTDFFNSLLQATDESSVAGCLDRLCLKESISWHPLGGEENNFGIIENQQSSPVAALIEKITNSIDAILMRHCLEHGIDPKSSEAPQSMEEAIEKFFPVDSKTWHIQRSRRKQSQSIQILANGSRKAPCLVVYDDGEGQHPEDFENTFLSLIKGNKNEIPFVQGKYNMGGTGSIVFCGKHRYQMIASRRFDLTGKFGFTLVRKHPFTEVEQSTKKNTWYEFMKIDGQIPSFEMDEIDIGLDGRKFRSGSIIKLFHYELPSGTRGALPQEPRRAINQFLFDPVLPLYLKDTPARYPNNKVLEGDSFGLKRRLEEDDSKYISEHFTEEFSDHEIGSVKVTCYVFNAKTDGRSAKETREIIQREFFHSSMAVLFSLNGQVQGFFTPEFITRTLKMTLLKNHLLIHVDCTHLNYDFRQNLFMASRDRLKSGEETAKLREKLGNLLRKGRLAEINKARKNMVSVEGGDTKDLLRSFSKGLPFNKDLMKLLNQTFKIEQHESDKKDKKPPSKPKEKKVKEPFNPNRYPSFFNMKSGKGKPYISIPDGSEKIIQFETDVEDQYFDRADDPGELRVTILQHKQNEAEGGDSPGTAEKPSVLLDVHKSSPKEGTIRLGLTPTSFTEIGDEIEIEATLGGPDDMPQKFWVKISEPNKKKEESKKVEDKEEPLAGLPQPVYVYESKLDDEPEKVTWSEMGDMGVDEMTWDDVMHPGVGDDGNLERVFINMDSSVLRNYISRQGSIGVEQKELAEKKYISSVYFHAIFLFSITKNKNYELRQGEKDIEVSGYLRDVFSSYYSEFLLNFGVSQLMDSLAD